MAGGCVWSRRVSARCRTLRVLVRDTQRALHDVADILHFDPELSIAVQELGNVCSRGTALVVQGSSPEARARLLHCLLGTRILPHPAPRGCRWLRIQYGSSTQVQLTLGNSEFELVEELQCNKQPWETLPLEDLLRQDETDLATVLEIEMNNSFLKEGLKIIVPPDIDQESSLDMAGLKKLHSSLYAKREHILKNFNPVYLYAVDKIGKNVFKENFQVSRKIMTSRSEEDFWASFSLYSMKNPNEEDVSEGNEKDEQPREVIKEACENAALNAENCLDLQQIKELDPHAQVLFALFSDSVDVEEEREVSSDNTESTEVTRADELPEADRGLVDEGRMSSKSEEKPVNRRLQEEQIAFMNELLDQWELMCSPALKHHVKSQYMIVDARPPPPAPAPAPAPPCPCPRPCPRAPRRPRAPHPHTHARVVKFAAECMQTYLLLNCAKLSEIHVKLLQQLILASFDMARELQVVPKKIQYVARQEHQLYQTISEKFTDGEKKQELVQIMQDVLREMTAEVENMDWSVDDLPCHQDRRFITSSSVFYTSTTSPEISLRPINLPTSPTDRSESPISRPTNLNMNSTDDSSCQTDRPTNQETPSDGEEAEASDSYNFDDYEIIHSNDEILSMNGYRSYRPPTDDSVSTWSQPGAIRVENESEMFSLSGAHWRNSSAALACSTGRMSVKQASLGVQHTVLSQLSRKISLKLVKFVDCLRDTYFGTLHRCLESLEWSCREELGGRPASEAMRQLVSVARTVDLLPCASFSVVTSLVDSLRRFFHKLRVSSAGGACCVLSAAWRRRAAHDTVQSLTDHALARIISVQILERLSVAHERYQSALTSLEAALANRLHHTEDVKLAIRKKYAPAFARLCLESTSMCDLLMYGTPELGREIGRGQYGVVYSARGAWAGRAVAVKSVLPADDRHYHDLAMEFFYTRSIPAHPRIVRVYGSLVQRARVPAAPPTVLLVSARAARDLHAALAHGLPAITRLRVSVDIVEGIRYLHSLGLVHRDIKMKNVLLDANDRASLSDLGFCAAEALISGSVVGTPVHMAPELLNGGYDASVDVYAFGILFWYVCAGHVRLPENFEALQNKEQLWSKVKKGLRPERLPHFSDECWDIMQSCWSARPQQRALLGHLAHRLTALLDHAASQPDAEHSDATEQYDDLSEDSLCLTP